MLDRFWESVGDKLAERWADVSVPALVFWLGGLLAWVYSHGGWEHLGPSAHWLAQLPVVGQVVIAVAALLGVAGSGLIVSRLTFPALTLLEGYWPSAFGPLRRLIIARIVTPAAEADVQAWGELADVLEIPDSATAQELARFARVDRRMHLRPARPSQYMPTRTGNILRAAETRPEDKYGLNTVLVWPRLWLILPGPVRDELTAARAALDSAVAAAVWGLLFCAFAWWTPLALVAGLGVAVGSALFWVPGCAETFGELLESAFDLYRFALYEQLRWPLPKDPDDERDTGRKLTQYVWRGTSEAGLVFAKPVEQVATD
jgi:hypothetical protein